MAFPTFDHYFQAVHGHRPYRWQSRLADRVDTDGMWPAGVSAPTGTGKTATLDIALWTLAHDIHTRGLAKRRLPQRIVLAVERRLIVDHAHIRAQRIADAIANTT